jgi:hypothetical protein
MTGKHLSFTKEPIMANADRPRGFVPAGHRNGGLVRNTTYHIAYNYGTAIYSGDAVLLSSGKITVATADSATLTGIFDGCSYKNDAGEQVFSRYWPGVALTDTAAVVTAYVYDDKGILFEAQCETGVAYVDATHVATACDLIATHAGSAITGQSGQEITPGTVGDAQFMIHRLIDRPDNAAGVNAKVLVSLNDTTVS